MAEVPAPCCCSRARPDRTHRARLPHRRDGPHHIDNEHATSADQDWSADFKAVAHAQDQIIQRTDAAVRASSMSRKADRIAFRRRQVWFEVRRVSLHRRDRGARGHRCQHGPSQVTEGPRHDDPADEPGSRRRNLTPTSPAQHRRTLVSISSTCVTARPAESHQKCVRASGATRPRPAS